MRGIEQLRKVAGDVVGIGAYRRRMAGEENTTPSDPLRGRLGAGLFGVNQVTVPFITRGTESDFEAFPPPIKWVEHLWLFRLRQI